MTATTDLRRTSLTIQSRGQELPEKWASRLLEARVQLGLRSIGRATITFADPGYVLADDNVFMLGGDVSILVEASTRIFTGRVHAVASEFRPGVDGVLVITVHDAAQRLATGSHIKVGQSVTLTDVVRELCSAAGLREGAVHLPDATLEYQLATDTPLGVIDEIAERTGRDWAVDGDSLAVWPAATDTAPSTGAVTLDAGETLVAFAVRRLAGGESTFEVHGWDPTAKQAVSAKTTRPTARGALKVHESDNGESATLVDAGAGVSTAADAETRAAGLAARAGRILAQGRAVLTPELRPGGEVTISGVGPGAGTFYVREVTHTFDAQGTSTAFVAGDRDPVRLTDPWAAPAAASSFRHAGLVVGVVDKIRDPDELGRVSVALPSLDSQVTTAWARVLTVGGGATRGFYVLPEVGDEVLVAFEDGDVARPVVLGGLFGKQNKVPKVDITDSGSVATRAFWSRLGHVLELSDGAYADGQHILLKLADGQHRFRLGKDRADLEVPDDVPLKIASGTSSISFDGKGNVTIEGVKITLKAQQGIELQGTTVTAKADTQLQVQGLQVSVKADTAVGVEAGGPLTLKGAMVAIN